MTILLKSCYENLKNKLNDLKFKEYPKLVNILNESKDMESLEDNVEYNQALKNLELLSCKINDISYILSNAVLFNESMKKNNTVTFGSTVEFTNIKTNIIKKYTIVSIYDSDIENNLISINSPFAKEMIGLHTNDYFSFNDNEYKIINIYYSF